MGSGRVFPAGQSLRSWHLEWKRNYLFGRCEPAKNRDLQFRHSSVVIDQVNHFPLFSPTPWPSTRKHELSVLNIKEREPLAYNHDERVIDTIDGLHFEVKHRGLVVPRYLISRWVRCSTFFMRCGDSQHHELIKVLGSMDDICGSLAKKGL